ncbi:2-oxoacid:acceptor oxidoreductase family protein [Sporosalibacterium faouarense]|uniref:2-oxoacid:acceptor oxidoreductase family protein n=1 Tax=Sporosalibacterium faouarense TaxID=516123 RepID=UPI00192AB29A|nr:2-oxoacid:acceptor oxidoreductase family protein [Sporosalibacterium faouarense]
MSNQCEIRLSGSGGQGLILGGIILAEAALNDGKNAVQSQSYGPEARGGASKAEVIISDNDINYPKVRECDILLSLTQLACDEYLHTLKENGVLVIDESVKTPDRDDIKVYSLPILKTASEKIRKPMVANIVALAVINQITKVTTKESLEGAVLKRVPRGTEDINTNALKEGFNLVNA